MHYINYELTTVHTENCCWIQAGFDKFTHTYLFTWFSTTLRAQVQHVTPHIEDVKDFSKWNCTFGLVPLGKSPFGIAFEKFPYVIFQSEIKSIPFWSILSLVRFGAGVMTLKLRNGKHDGAHILLAHELGHLMGVKDHDGTKSARECRGKTIMKPTVEPDFTKWSACSR